MYKCRCRNYTCVLYLDKLPINYLEILDSLHISYMLSPIHVNELNSFGKIQRPHRHLIFLFDTLMFFDCAKKFTDILNGFGLIYVDSLRDCVRNFCHLDNPKKIQYSRSDIITSSEVEHLKYL